MKEGVSGPGRTSGKRNLDTYFKRVRVDGTEREIQSANSSTSRVFSGMEGEEGGEEGGSQRQEQGNVTEDSRYSSSSGIRQDEEKNDDEYVGGGLSLIHI